MRPTLTSPILGISLDTPPETLARLIANRTGADDAALREMIARTRAIIGRQRPTPTPAARSNPEYDRGGKWKYRNLLDELRAESCGRELGRLYEHDPWKLAAHFNLPVITVAADKLAAIAGCRVSGRFVPEARTIMLADNLSPHERNLALAHELGHAGGVGMEVDANAELFARHFVERPTPQSPELAGRAAWREMQQRQQDRAVAARRRR